MRHLRTLLAALALLLPLPAMVQTAAAQTVGPQNVGWVRELQVFAYGTPPARTRAPVYLNHGVVQRELLETVRDGALLVRFLDNSELAMGSAASLVIDELIYDPRARDGRMLVNLAQGAFRFVSGEMNKDGMRIETPSVIIGIRGTDFSVAVDAAGTTQVAVFSGQVTVTPKVAGAAVAADAASVAAGNWVRMNPAQGIRAAGAGAPPTGDESIDHTVTVFGGYMSLPRGGGPGGDAGGPGDGAGGGQGR